MILFFDEDTGGGVPTALRALGIRAASIPMRGLPKGTPDEVWIPIAGKRRWLAFSCNTGILEAEAQRDLLRSEKVGAVFLTSGQEKKVEVMKLVLRKLPWFEEIHTSVPRPFAFAMPIRGRTKRVY